MLFREPTDDTEVIAAKNESPVFEYVFSYKTSHGFLDFIGTPKWQLALKVRLSRYIA